MCRKTEFVRVFGIVGFSDCIDDNGLNLTDALKSMKNTGWDLEDNGVEIAGKELIHGASCGRTFAVVVADNFHHPAHHAKIILLFAMIMPCLGDTRAGSGEIDLTEFVEERLVPLQNFHETAALVSTHFEALDLHAVDSGMGAGLIFFHAENQRGFPANGGWSCQLIDNNDFCRARNKTDDGREASASHSRWA